ncbi:MAG TPA: CDP-archaeol synthase [Methylomicrobium sp.]|nr:CDP-archaeol synthase [Methylomicrobium sp.]
MGVETSLILMLKALLLLVTANGAPVLVSAFAGRRVAEPIDGSFKFGDGRPLFGVSKTWLGLFVSLTATIAIAFALGYSLITGALFATASMVGDLLASFCKRRFGWAEGTHVRGLDTVPESILPLLVLQSQLSLGWIEIGLVIGAFFVLEEGVSPVLFRLHLRNRP